MYPIWQQCAQPKATKPGNDKQSTLDSPAYPVSEMFHTTSKRSNLVPCVVDINECAIGDYSCPSDQHQCVNKIGSYECCEPGYTADAYSDCTRKYQQRLLPTKLGHLLYFVRISWIVIT